MFHNSKIKTLALCAVLFGALLSGCGSSGSSGGVSVGDKLYMSDGSIFGTVVAVEESHQFENGTVEPGVLVDYSPRIPDQQNWLPMRSAETMAK